MEKSLAFKAICIEAFIGMNMPLDKIAKSYGTSTMTVSLWLSKYYFPKLGEETEVIVKQHKRWQ